jgi:hypothetical protein
MKVESINDVNNFATFDYDSKNCNFGTIDTKPSTPLQTVIPVKNTERFNV